MSRDMMAARARAEPSEGSVDGRRPRVVLVAVGGMRRASSRLRAHWWVPRLEAVGFDCRVFTYYDRPGRGDPGILRSKLPRLTTALDSRALWPELIEAARGADCVYFQEVLPPASVIDRIRAGGARIVFDFSDPLHFAAAPGHRLHHKMLNRWVTRPRMRAMLSAADWAIVENDRLAELVERWGSRPAILRGPIDADLYRPVKSPADGVVTLGWTGSNGTLSYLEPLLPIISQLAEAHPQVELRVYGVDREISAPGVRVWTHPWDKQTEPGVVGSFDISLNYLPETPWTRVRGGLKLIVYLACGAPIVTSPSGIGEQVIEHGRNGLLARTSGEWTDALRLLVEDAPLRERLGQAARQDAVSLYSYDAYLPLMTSLLAGGEPVEDPLADAVQCPVPEVS